MEKVEKRTCHKCKARSGPMSRCHKCGNIFCFEHIYGIQVNNKMRDIDRAVDVCEDCKKKYGYFTVGERRRIYDK